MRCAPLPVSIRLTGAESQASENAPVVVVTASLNTTLISLAGGTLLAPSAGVIETTVGGVVAGSRVWNTTTVSAAG